MEGETVEAPLKEALAAGMLVWGGWDRVAAPALRRAEAKRRQAKKGSINNEIRMVFRNPILNPIRNSISNLIRNPILRAKSPILRALQARGRRKPKRYPLIRSLLHRYLWIQHAEAVL